MLAGVRTEGFFADVSAWRMQKAQGTKRGPAAADPCEGFGGTEGAAMRAFQAALELRGRRLEPSTNFWQAGGDSLAANLVCTPLTLSARACTASMQAVHAPRAEHQLLAGRRQLPRGQPSARTPHPVRTRMHCSRQPLRHQPLNTAGHQWHHG